MLAPSKDGRFPVPAAPSVLPETGSFRQLGPQMPNVADFSSCGHSPAHPVNAAQTASHGRTGGLCDGCDGRDRKSLTHFSRHSRHCCHRHRIRYTAGERPLFGCQRRGCRVYPGRKRALQASLKVHLGRLFLPFHVPAMRSVLWRSQ